ncbi:hypothetical protein Tco_0771120 [Tanacetum coccineum]|uniref:Uncharacterized protein n=1 Tax=Tanacetum coccineum TaxID=301880 RepID=A0ABQ4ZE38_9ASTR
MVELRADVKLKETHVVVVPKFVGESYTMSTISVEYEWTPPRCSSCKVGLKLSSKVQFKPTKQVYQHVSKKNGASSSWLRKGDNSNVVSSTHRISDKAFGNQAITPLVARINDLESQMLDGKLMLKDDNGKLMLVDDNGKPLKRLMIRLMQIVIVKWARLTMKTSYNDNDFDDCGLTDAHKKFANSFNISLRGQLRWRMMLLVSEPKFLIKMSSRRSEGEESEYPFFEGDGSSSDEWEDYGVAGGDYEGPPIFYDDQYEEESMSVYTDIEDVIDEEEDNMEDVVVVVIDLCSSKIQTTVSVNFSKTVDSNPQELILLKKGNLVEVSILICKKYQEEYLKVTPMDDKFSFKTIKVRGRVIIKKGNLMQGIQIWMLRVQGTSEANSRTSFFQVGENDADMQSIDF